MVSLPDSEQIRPSTATGTAASPIHLRMWPAILVVIAMWAAITLPTALVPGTMPAFMGMVFGPVLGLLAIVGWWVFASRAPWRDRWLVLAVVVGGGALAAFASHKSVPMLMFLFGAPIVVTVWIGWLAVTQQINWSARRGVLLAVALAIWGYYPLIRVDGTDGSIKAQTSWRWASTAEEDFLASQRKSIPAAADVTASEGTADTDIPALTLTPGDWPAFRGPNRDDRLEGVRINDDWNRSPPKLVWKKRLGPGWGAFTVIGDRLFTQEQRGDNEAVVCYSAEDGNELWIHQDTARFWEVIGGAGPRATPTFHEGRLYTVGANGRLNCLDAASGRRIWGVDMITSADVKVPDWGYASSPLIFGDLVIVTPGRPNGSAVQAFDRATGERVWSAGEGTHSYSSPHWAKIDGVEHIVSQTDKGLQGLDPSNGRVLWEHTWHTAGDGARVLQPYVDGDTVIATTYFGIGSRRLRVTRNENDWLTTVEWESRDFKPYFNDFVVQDGYAYGFDVNIFCCLDLKTGKRTWKGGRYGHGQVLLVADQGLLVVLSETGEAILVKADPKRLTELGRFAALEGKTWNHPVIVRGKLYVRNAQEMACYDVAPTEEVAAK